MAKGGARVSSGPPPDPNALSRDRPSDRAGWTVLPAKRSGQVPAWPLRTNAQTAAALLNTLEVDKDLPIGRDATGADDREATVWAEIWRMPQAAAWEQLGWIHDVALYVRWLVMAEGGDMKTGSEARQWSDRLGLNPAAMLRNRWKVSTDEVAERREPQAPRTRSSRSRLTVVAGGDAAV